MEPARAGSLLTYLSQVPDPRGRKGRRHSLSAMLTAVVCGLLCGARGYEGLVEWLHDQTVDIWHWMGFTRRPPRKDCFRDLLMKLDPVALNSAVQDWVRLDLELSDDVESVIGVSLDGKSLCATLRTFSRVVHLLAAVDHQTGCVLSQMRVDEKTNEHKTALELLKQLVMKGRVVVADAAHCQRDFCQQILDSGGDYLISVKENQPSLLREIQQEFIADKSAFSPYTQQERASEQRTAQTIDKGHGRLEKRSITTTTSLNNHLNWPGVNQVCRIVRERTQKDRLETETAYYITSVPRNRATAANLLELARRHWGAIENGVHYARDTTLDEDRCTIFRGDAPENLATLRNLALNWLRRTGVDNIAAKTRSFSRQSQRLFAIFGNVK